MLPIEQDSDERHDPKSRLPAKAKILPANEGIPDSQRNAATADGAGYHFGGCMRADPDAGNGDEKHDWRENKIGDRFLSGGKRCGNDACDNAIGGDGQGRVPAGGSHIVKACPYGAMAVNGYFIEGYGQSRCRESDDNRKRRAFLCDEIHIGRKDAGDRARDGAVPKIRDHGVDHIRQAR